VGEYFLAGEKEMVSFAFAFHFKNISTFCHKSSKTISKVLLLPDDENFLR